MAMVLLLPTEVGAWGTLNLRSSIKGNWTGTNDDTFKQGTNDNYWTKEIDARNITGDIFFRIYINTNNEQIYPKDGDGIELGNGMSTSDYNQNGNGANWSWKIPNSTTKFDKYIITANYINNNDWKWVISVTGKNIDAYVPTLGKKDEISCFVEVPSTINEVKIWAWGDSYNYSMDVASSEDWGNRPSMTYMGETISGNKVYKWTYTGTHTGKPSKVIFTKGDAETDKFAKDIAFTNHGYYVYDGKNNIESSSKIDIITDVSGGETTTTTTAYIKYGDEPIASTSTKAPYVFTIPKSAYHNGISFALQTVKTTTTGGNTTKEYTNYTGTGLKNNSTGVDYTATTATDDSYGAKWEYVADEGKEPTDNITVTLNTTTKKVSLKHAVAGTTPVTSENYYLVGNFFPEDGNNINYNRKIFRFEPDGLGNYTLDIPATLTVDCQVIGVKDGVVTVYAPSGAYEIKGDCPNDNLAVSGTLATTTLDDASNKWSFTTRNLTSDGIYTITLSESATKWDIKHNGNKRMAYYLSTMDGATAQPSYTEDRGSWVTTNGKPAYDNRYFGYIYLEKDAKCWIISNLLTQFDNGNSELSKTAPKLYLQGNENGVIGGGDGGAKVFPNGTSNITSKPFTIGNEEKALSVMLEYNPTQGHNNGDYSYELGNEQTVSGRVLKVNSTDAAGSSLPEITSMQILGPGVNGSWKVNEAIPMTYNPTERCWQATVYTNKEESKDNLFRFIVNNSLMYNFGDDETKARVPYLTATDGVSALPSDPNKVIYHKESSETGKTGDDIIFNRPAGEWTVRFYITQHISGKDGQYTYDFKYTIDGREYNDEVTIPSTKVGEKYVLLRTYSNIIDCKPVDDNVHIFVAHKFAKEGTDTKYEAITGKVHLYEINYIPANTGVVLYAGEGQEALTVKLVQASDINSTDYTESLTNKDYLWKRKDNHTSESFNNDLVAVLTSTKVGPSVIKNDEIVARNFGLGKFSSTKDYKEGTDTDRIGFFRLMEGTMGGHKAYLQYKNGQYGIDGNSQILDKKTDVNTVTFSKVVLIFEGFDDNETTGINEIISATDKAKDVYYYNLQGIRVTNPSKGIYINNGKKVIIK